MSKSYPAGAGQPASTRRVRLTPHSTTISNAVLLGYASLSDGARLTYMVLESYDWPDKDGFSKGCCWPSIETIASVRGKSYDSIARHLKELEAAGLIRVESGQERGVANCYWLLGPSEEEFAAYLQNFSETAVDNETYRDANTCPVFEVPQPRGRGYGKNALPGPAKMPGEKHEIKEPNLKKSEPEKDSNPFHSRSNKEGPTAPERSRSPYISQIILDFSKSLNDLAHAPSNQSQAQSLFRQSGLDERPFVELLYEAKKRTQWAAIATPKTTGNGPNRAAYFFKVVRNLLEEKSCATPGP